MKMAVAVPNSEAGRLHGLTVKQLQCAAGAKRTKKTSPAEHSRKSEAQNIRARRDCYVLTTAGGIGHGSGLDRVVGRDVPQTLSVFLIDCHQISVRIRIDQNAPRRGQHSSPSLALDRPGLRDLPNDFSCLDVEGAKVLPPRFQRRARLVPSAR